MVLINVDAKRSQLLNDYLKLSTQSTIQALEHSNLMLNDKTLCLLVDEMRMIRKYKPLKRNVDTSYEDIYVRMLNFIEYYNAVCASAHNCSREKQLSIFNQNVKGMIFQLSKINDFIEKRRNAERHITHTR